MIGYDRVCHDRVDDVLIGCDMIGLFWCVVENEC